MATGQDYIGPYRLLNLLRTGSNCQIWEVKDSKNDRRCALKTLMTEYRHRRGHASALRREFEIGKEMEHPNVIHSLDFGVTPNNVYLTMELFDAPNLKQILQQQALHPDQQRIDHQLPEAVEQAAKALEYFHSKGWIHRDIKPHNFLMNSEGQVRLIDFSLASRIKTGIGKILGGKPKVQGTRSYMSPEQIRGLHLDERTDLYGFGCMLHELFTGKPPFTGFSSNELLVKHLRSPAPSIEAWNQNITPQFAALVLRCLAKKPEDRPGDMSDFLKEFQSIKVYKNEPQPSGR